MVFCETTFRCPTKSTFRFPWKVEILCVLALSYIIMGDFMCPFTFFIIEWIMWTCRTPKHASFQHDLFQRASSGSFAIYFFSCGGSLVYEASSISELCISFSSFKPSLHTHIRVPCKRLRVFDHSRTILCVPLFSGPQGRCLHHGISFKVVIPCVFTLYLQYVAICCQKRG
jgi:hypothetical protein